MREYFKSVDNVNEINTIIFLESLLYYNFQEDRMVNLINKRKNLESMLDSLFKNLSQKESVLILKDCFKSYGLRTLYRIMT